MIKHRRLVCLIYLGEAGFLFLTSVGMAVGVLRGGRELFEFSHGNHSLPLIGPKSCKKWRPTITN